MEDLGVNQAAGGAAAEAQGLFKLLPDDTPKPPKKKPKKMEDLEVNQAARGAAAEAQDLFKLLPDDTIISHIFDKISDAKTLYICSLVSKHISSLVYQTSNVSVRIPLRILHEKPDPTPPPTRVLIHRRQPVHCFTVHLRNFPGMMHQFLRKSPSDPVPFDFKFISSLATEFLTKFTSLKSLYLEFDCTPTSGSINPENEPLARWMFDSKSASFIAFIFPRILDHDNYIYSEDLDLIQILFDSQLVIALNTFSLMETYFPFLPSSLRRVIITDSRNRGKLDLGDVDLVEMRNRSRNFEHGDEKRIRFMDAGPFREGPLSGNFLIDNHVKWVIMAIKRDNDDDDYLAVKNALRGKGEVLIEAVVEMVKEARGSF